MFPVNPECDKIEILFFFRNFSSKKFFPKIIIKILLIILINLLLLETSFVDIDLNFLKLFSFLSLLKLSVINTGSIFF